MALPLSTHNGRNNVQIGKALEFRDQLFLSRIGEDAMAKNSHNPKLFAQFGELEYEALHSQEGRD